MVFAPVSKDIIDNYQDFRNVQNTILSPSSLFSRASYFEFEEGTNAKDFTESLSEAELIFQLFWSRVAAKPVKTVTDDDEKKSIFQKFSKRRDTIICHWHKFSWGILSKT